MNQWQRFSMAGVLALAAVCASAQDKVVYHIGDTQTQALAGLRNVRNHLDVDPTAQITVVALSQGVDFLMEDAKDASGTAYDSLVSALKSRGVKFEVCEITLKNRGLKKAQFIQEADFTPSGVVRLTKLQVQGWAYIKP
jgi:intracellular sulfur oxidation DsrE/DsrF family protein